MARFITGLHRCHSPVVCGSIGTVSQIPDQVTHANVEGCSDASKRIDGDGLFHALHLANIFGIQFGRLAQPFLGHVRLFAIVPNGLAERFPMRGMCCHKVAG
jgi:hypothetical protein